MQLKIYVKLIAAALLLVVLFVSVFVAVLRGNELRQAKADLDDVQSELDAVKVRAEVYYEVNKGLLANLEAAQQHEKETMRALEAALSENKKWADSPLPESVKKAIKP